VERKSFKKTGQKFFPYKNHYSTHQSGFPVQLRHWPIFQNPPPDSYQPNLLNTPEIKMQIVKEAMETGNNSIVATCPQQAGNQPFYLLLQPV